MLIEPSSNVRFLKGISFDINHKNVVHFNDTASQQAYFISMTSHSMSGCSYIKEQRKIRASIKADELFDCNYLMYQNPAYGVKWFYAFITDIEYVNNETSYISFVIDDMQTWLLGTDYQIMPSFVEREHVSDDTIGAHIMDEGLAINDFITNSTTSEFFDEWYICVGSTIELHELAKTPIGGRIYAGIYSGVCWYCFPSNEAGVIALNYVLEHLDAGIDAIVSMFMIPKAVLSMLQDSETTFKMIPTINAPAPIGIVNTKVLDGYVPRNQKLLTYPYRSIVLSNNEGNSVILRYEFFTDATPAIDYVGGMQPNSRIIAYPKNYKGVEQNLQEGVSVGNFPQCCWQKDIYGSWLASQSVRWGYQKQRMFLDAFSGASSSARDGAKMGAQFGSAGMIAGAGIGVGNGVAKSVPKFVDFYHKMGEEKEVHSMIPNGVEGTIGNGYTNISIGKYGFLIENKSIKEEIARSIDGYFDMFGYKVNEV